MSQIERIHKSTVLCRRWVILDVRQTGHGFLDREVEMAHGIEEFVKLAPAVWPGEALGIQPGDLSLFAPMGNGLGAPMVIRPWDDLGDVASRGAYYEFHTHTGHPFTGAPKTEADGGTIYFDQHCQREDIEAMLRLMGVYGKLTDYAAFLQETTNPEDCYVSQLRIVGGHALQFLFRTSDEPEQKSLRQQSLPISEVIWRFIEWFRQEYDAGRYSVDGVLGGDGDWANESLAFGFMVENQYHSIYRIWTRAWLVTK